MTSHITPKDWALIVIIGAAVLYAVVVFAGRALSAAWDKSEAALRGHPPVDWAKVERDSRKARRTVPSARRSTSLPAITTPLHNGRGGEAQQAAELRKRMARIQKSAVHAALEDFAKGTTHTNPHAPQTLGYQHWQSNYDRVMLDQRRTSAELLSLSNTRL